MGDDDAIAFLHTSAKNALASVFLRVEHHSGSAEVPQRLVDAGGLHNAAVLRNVAEEHGQSAILCIGMLQVANATLAAIGVECVVTLSLRTHRCREAVAGSAVVDGLLRAMLVGFARRDVIQAEGLSDSHSIDPATVGVQQTTLVQFTHDAQNATGAVAILHGVFLGVRCEFAQAGHSARQGIDVLHRKVYASLLGNGEQMQHGIGGTAHSDINSHGIQEGFACSNRARQHAFVAGLIVGKGIQHHLSRSSTEEFHAVLVRGEQRSIARKRKADGLGERVHGVGSEHSRATTTAWTRRLLHFSKRLVVNMIVGAHHHR